GARRELAEGPRLVFESVIHPARESDGQRLDSLFRRRVVAARLLGDAAPCLREREGARRREPGRGALDRRRTPVDAALLPFRRAIARGAFECGGMNDLVDEAGAQRAAGREAASAQDEIQCARQPDEAGEPLRAAAGRDETERDLR